MKPKTYTFYIDMPSDMSAGLHGFTDKLTIILESGDPGGEEGEFETFMRECLNEWYEGASVMGAPEAALIRRKEDLLELSILWDYYSTGELDHSEEIYMKTLENRLGVCQFKPEMSS